jgi:hypothetical protein
MTRLEIIDALVQLDTTTLSRLLRLSQTILVPDQDSLTRVTFNDMLDGAHAYADTHFPQWTDRSKADFGEFIIELFCLYSEKDYYYMNQYANEGFLQKAKNYVNVYYKAMQMGYRPVRNQSSDAEFQLRWNTGGAIVLIYPGDIEVTLADGSVFTNGDTISVPSGGSTYSMVRRLYSGKYTTTQTIFNGRSVRIQANECDWRSVTMSTADGTQWGQVDSFAESDAGSTVFMIYATEGDDFEVVFGTGGFGRRPDVGEILTFKYRQAVNGGVNPAYPQAGTITKNTPDSLLEDFDMISAPGRAALPETIESIRHNASLLGTTRGNNCLRNHYDCIALLSAMPDVQVAGSFLFARQVYFSVVPKIGGTATPAFLSELAARLKPITMECFELQPTPTNYVDITELTITAYMQDTFNTPDGEQQILDYLHFITDPEEGAKYGVGFDMGVVTAALIQQIEGLQQVVYNSINGAAAANIVLLPLSIFNRIDDVNVTIIMVPVL